MLRSEGRKKHKEARHKQLEKRKEWEAECIATDKGNKWRKQLAAGIFALALLIALEMRLSKNKKQKTMEAQRPVGLIEMRQKIEQQLAYTELRA
eukprot:gene29417-8712_t